MNPERFREIAPSTVTEEETDAAIRAIHHRLRTGRLTGPQAVEVLQMLGLAETTSGGHYDPIGRRDTRKRAEKP